MLLHLDELIIKFVLNAKSYFFVCVEGGGGTNKLDFLHFFKKTSYTIPLSPTNKSSENFVFPVYLTNNAQISLLINSII